MKTEPMKPIAGFEFDQFPNRSCTIEVRESEDGEIDIVLCGEEKVHLLGANIDQWGTWYHIGNTVIVAQEWGTRSFVAALIEALGKFRERAEVDTLPPTPILRETITQEDTP